MIGSDYFEVFARTGLMAFTYGLCPSESPKTPAAFLREAGELHLVCVTRFTGD